MKQKQENGKPPDSREALQKALIKGRVNIKLQSEIKRNINYK